MRARSLETVPPRAGGTPPVTNKLKVLKMSSGPALPITAREFDALMTALQPACDADHIAVAVSGGSDSMALTLLLRDWADATGKRLTAITVDHGLRAESGEEASRVAAWLAQRAISHVTLDWVGDKPDSNLQSAARKARYALMDEWCGENGASCLALAHQLEDQAETFLLRLGRGSGVYGLAAMDACLKPAAPDAPWRIRPLLDMPKARLKATLEARGQEWIEDPSNRLAKFSRVRVRALREPLASVGITPERLAATARHLARARSLIEAQADAVLAESAALQLGGYCSVNVRALVAEHEEVGLRALSRILMAVSGAEYAPRFERLERLWSRLASGSLGGGATLLGCRIKPAKSGEVVVFRELRSMGSPAQLEMNKAAIWDGRYRLRLNQADSVRSSIVVDRLGREGWKALRQADHGLSDAGVPDIVQHVGPALWDAEGLLAAPAHRYFRPNTPENWEIGLEYLPGVRDRAFAPSL